jgi:hypothetical protein
MTPQNVSGANGANGTTADGVAGGNGGPGQSESVSKVRRISEAPSAIFSPNGTHRYESPKSGGRRFAFPTYANARTLSGTR